MVDWTDFDAMYPVSGPMGLSVWFVRTDSHPPAQEFILSGDSGALARALLLGSLSATARDSFDTLLTEDLATFFDKAWQDKIPAIKDQMREKILEGDSHAHDFSYDVIEHGKLRGAVQDFSPDMKQRYPAGTTGQQITLIYQLNGIATKFKARGLTLVLKVEAKINFKLGFPARTALGAQIVVDSQVNPWLEGDSVWDGIALDIAELFGLVDDPDSSTGFELNAGGQLLQALTAGLGLASQFGFITTDLVANYIPNPDYHGPAGPSAPTGGSPPPPPPPTPPEKLVVLQINLRHPQDPAPAFFIPAPTNLSPLFQTDRTHVYPGDTVGIFGSNWPYTPWNSFEFYFRRTTSGQWKTSEVQFGIIPPGQTAVNPVQKATVAHLYPTVDDDSFRMPNLPPNTHVACRVREFDLPDFICTDWTAWKDGFTSSQIADAVAFSVRLPNGGLLGLDSTSINVEADGAISGRVDIPQFLAPGTYDLVGRMALNESISYTTQIVIDDSSAAPSLQLFNIRNQPNGDATHPARLWAATQYLRGYHLKHNVHVTLSLDGTGAAGLPLQQLNLDMTGTVLHPGSTTDARGDFFTNFEYPRDHLGAHTLYVVEDIPGGMVLSLPIEGI